MLSDARAGSTSPLILSTKDHCCKATVGTLLLITGILSFCERGSEAQPFSTIPIVRLGKGSCEVVAYSPDGRLMAAAGSAGVIWLYDAETLQEIGSLRGHASAVTSIAFSPDGQLIASGTGHGMVGLWSVAREELAAWLKPPEETGEATRAVAFSPDGRLLVSVGEKGALLRKIPSGELVTAFGSGYYSVAFNPDGQLLALGLQNSVSTWDVVEKRYVASMKVNTIVRAVAFSGDSRLLAITAEKIVENRNTPVVQIWDIARYEEVATIVGSTAPIAFSPDGRLLLSAGKDYTIQVWDVPQRQTVGSLAGHRGRVTSVAFGPDGRHVLSGSEDRTARIWDVSLLQETAQLPRFTSFVKAVAFRPDGGQLASGGGDRLTLWDVEEPQAAPTTLGRAGLLLSVAYSPDGSLVAWGGYNETIQVWDLIRREEVATLTGYAPEVLSIAFSPDGRFMASLSKNSSTVRLWDVIERREVAPLATGLWGIRSLAFSRDGNLLATAGTPDSPSPWDTGPRPNVYFWDLAQRQLVRALTLPLAGMLIAFSPDGSILASAGAQESVHICDVATGQHIAALDTLVALEESAWTNSIAFSPDGHLLAIGTLKGMYLWDLKQDRLVLALTGQLGEITSVAFSSDGRFLASGSDDGTVFLWQARETGPDDEQDAPIPTGLVLAQNSPNPFTLMTTIVYGLPEATGLRLSIFDIAGREIRTLVDGDQDAGWHEAVWDGRDGRGRLAGSGIYCCRLQARKEGAGETRKMLFVR